MAVVLNVYRRRLTLGKCEMMLFHLNLSGLKRRLVYSVFKSLR